MKRCGCDECHRRQLDRKIAARYELENIRAFQRAAPFIAVAVVASIIAMWVFS